MRRLVEYRDLSPVFAESRSPENQVFQFMATARRPNYHEQTHRNGIRRIGGNEKMRVVNLGQEIDKIDADYLRDTGTMIYTTKSKGKGNSVINIVRTTIQRPAVTRK